MELYEKMQFGFLLQTATERFVARLEERFRGPEGALKNLHAGCSDEGDALSDFVDALFEDFLIHNVEGACFVLQSMPNRSVKSLEGGTVEATLITMAKRLFSELLLKKTIESLEQHSSFQSVRNTT